MLVIEKWYITSLNNTSTHTFWGIGEFVLVVVLVAAACYSLPLADGATFLRKRPFLIAFPTFLTGAVKVR